MPLRGGLLALAQAARPDDHADLAEIALIQARRESAHRLDGLGGHRGQRNERKDVGPGHPPQRDGQRVLGRPVPAGDGGRSARGSRRARRASAACARDGRAAPPDRSASRAAAWRRTPPRAACGTRRASRRGRDVRSVRRNGSAVADRSPIDPPFFWMPRTSPNVGANASSAGAASPRYDAFLPGSPRSAPTVTSVVLSPQSWTCKRVPWRSERTTTRSSVSCTPNPETPASDNEAWTARTRGVDDGAANAQPSPGAGACAGAASVDPSITRPWCSEATIIAGSIDGSEPHSPHMSTCKRAVD